MFSGRGSVLISWSGFGSYHDSQLNRSIFFWKSANKDSVSINQTKRLISCFCFQIHVGAVGVRPLVLPRRARRPAHLCHSLHLHPGRHRHRQVTIILHYTLITFQYRICSSHVSVLLNWPQSQCLDTRFEIVVSIVNKHDQTHRQYTKRKDNYFTLKDQNVWPLTLVQIFKNYVISFLSEEISKSSEPNISVVRLF